MTNKIISSLSLAAAILFSSVSVSAQEKGNIAFSYDTGAGSKTFFGSQKKENYDVAIHMPGDELAGETIVGVAVPMQAAEVSNIKVWLSKELTLEMIDGKKENVPDVMTIDAELKSGWINITLPEAYTITTEGIYVGYSFDVDELNDNTSWPVMVTTETAEGGLFIHSSRKYRSWQDASETCSSCMLVMLSGADANSVSVGEIEDVVTGANIPTVVSVPIINHGYEGVKNFDYTYEVAGVEHSGHIELGDNTIGGLYNARKTIDIENVVVATPGVYPFKISISKVNGADNTCENIIGEGSIKVLESVPTHRAVIEEYTGLWCGYCPRGWAAMETMSELYPEDFICLAYHSGTQQSPDAMAVTDNFPSNVSGFPTAFIDRCSRELDPYHGSNMYSFEMGIENDWKLRCREISPADLTISAELSEDGSIVDMKTNINFSIPTKETGYKVEFVLLADSLKNEKWRQTNYFVGETDYLVNDKMKQFVEGESKVAGLYFNDVVVASSRLNETDAKLPAEINVGDSFDFNYTFDVSSIKNVFGVEFVQDKTNFRVVALLIDSNGQIVNANKAKVNSDAYQAGVENIVIDTIESEKAFYDLSGRRLDSPKKGINIILDSNGNAQKVLVK